MSVTIRVFTLATLFFLSFAASATAQEEGPVDNKAKARELFAKGKKLFEEDKPAQAAAAFREANELHPTWKLQYNIGQCELAAKRPGLAMEAFEAYLNKGGDDVPQARREEVLAELGRLKVVVGGLDVIADEGAVVVVNDMERGKLPLSGPIMLAAGIEHHIVVKSGDEVVTDRTVKVSGSKTFKLDLREDKEAPVKVVVQQVEKEEEPLDPLVTWGWVTTGVGAAALIAGGVTGGLTMKKNSELADNCDGTAEASTCDHEFKEDHDAAKKMALTTDILMISGGVIAATGVVMLIVGYSRSAKEEEPAASDEVDMAISPLAGPGLVGAGVTGRF